MKIGLIWISGVALVIAMALACSGCMTQHGLYATGPVSYAVGAGIANDHVATATAKGPLMEVRASDGKMLVGFNLLNLNGWSVMTLWERFKYGTSVAAEGYVYGRGIQYGAEKVEDWQNRKDKVDPLPINNDGIAAQNNGSGSVDIDWTIQQGSRLPSSVSAQNNGEGSVHVSVTEIPLEK